jgi:hypothetical protein
MPVETLKDALSASWRVRARRSDGQVDYRRSSAECQYQAELDARMQHGTCRAQRSDDVPALQKPAREFDFRAPIGAGRAKG